MKKGIAAFVACALMLMCCCENGDIYTSCLCTLHDCLGKEYSPFWNISDNTETRQTDAAEKKLTVNGEEIFLAYRETVCGGLYRSSRMLDRYCDSSGLICADFRPSDGKMIRLYAGTKEADADVPPAFTEEEMKSKAVEMVSLYAQADGYRFVSYSRGQNKEYMISYAKFVGELKTSDTVQVTFSENGRFSGIEFGDRDAFAQVDGLSIDETTVENSIKKALTEDLYSELVEIIEYRAEDRWVAYSTEQETVVVTKAAFKLRNLKNGSEFETVFMFASRPE